ncbi:MAG: right-handed parallel beta-helix repeat-containing protein [Ferruginibacter sp.]
MKNLITISLLLTCLLSRGQIYYVSPTGNDANLGTSSSLPWKTIAKINASFSTLSGGGMVLFQRDGKFYGSVIANKSGSSGNVITIGAYGTGAKPILTGFTEVTSWSLAGGIYSAPATAKADVNMVVMDGAIMHWARKPNSGWSVYPLAGTTTGKGATNYYTTTGAPDSIIGDESIRKVKDWNNQHETVNGISVINKRIYIQNPTDGNVYGGIEKYGYFRQKNLYYLDTTGEYYYASGSLKLKDNPLTSKVKISTIDTGINLGTRGYITIENIQFEGYGKFGVYAFNASTGTGNITVQDCDFNYMGMSAVTLWQIPNAVITRSTATDCLGNGFFIRNSGSGGLSGSTITYCTVANTCLVDGHEISGDAAGRAGITVNGGTNVVCKWNTVENSGYVGIEWSCSNNGEIAYNVISYYCMRRQDGGAIYSFGKLTQNGYIGRSCATWTNVSVHNNFLFHGIGSNAGTTSKLKARGPYQDECVNGVNIYSNYCEDIADVAYYNNSNYNLTFRDNAAVNCGGSFNFNRFKDAPDIRNVSVKRNLFFPYSGGWFNNATDSLTSKTPLQDIQAGADIDSNYFSVAVSSPFVLYGRKYSTSTGATYTYNSLSYWTGTAGFDTHSRQSFGATDELRKEFNFSMDELTVNLGAKYIDVDGNIVTSITLPAFGYWIGKYYGPLDAQGGGRIILLPWKLIKQ